MIWIFINLMLAGFNFYWYSQYGHSINLLAGGFILGVTTDMVIHDIIR